MQVRSKTHLDIIIDRLIKFAYFIEMKNTVFQRPADKHLHMWEKRNFSDIAQLYIQMNDKFFFVWPSWGLLLLYIMHTIIISDSFQYIFTKIRCIYLNKSNISTSRLQENYVFLSAAYSTTKFVILNFKLHNTCNVQ